MFLGRIQTVVGFVCHGSVSLCVLDTHRCRMPFNDRDMDDSLAVPFAVLVRPVEPPLAMSSLARIVSITIDEFPYP